MKNPRERIASPSGRHARGKPTLWKQTLLVFALCMGLVGVVLVFVNAWVIAGLKEKMMAQALLLAEDAGRRTSEQILAMLESDGGDRLLALQHDPRLTRQMEVVLRSNNRLIAACVLDSDGEVVLASYGENEAAWMVSQGEDGISARLAPKPSNFFDVTVRLREIDPGIRTRAIEVPIHRGDEALMGRVRLLVSESDIYQDISATGQEITRRLWGVALGFFGVLALGLSLMGRLSRRQVDLLAENAQLDRMAYVGTLASGLAHEIRNPLNAMSVNLAVAEEELAHSGDSSSLGTASRALALLRREISRLNNSVTNFMKFSHPAVERSEKMRLRAVVDEVLDLLAPQIADLGVDVEVDLDEQGELMGDFSGLRQVVHNVVLNALQAMAELAAGERPRRLRIGGRRESAQWLLWIEDTGPGIPEGSLGEIFEAFYSSKAAGSGFGLAIARAIVSAHDGDIRARPADGGGLRIEVTLPETDRHK